MNYNWGIENKHNQNYMTIKIKKDGSMEIDLGAIISKAIQTCADVAKSNGGRVVRIDYPQIEQIDLAEKLVLAEHREN